MSRHCITDCDHQIVITIEIWPPKKWQLNGWALLIWHLRVTLRCPVLSWESEWQWDDYQTIQLRVPKATLSMLRIQVLSKVCLLGPSPPRWSCIDLGLHSFRCHFGARKQYYYARVHCDSVSAPPTHAPPPFLLIWSCGSCGLLVIFTVHSCLNSVSTNSGVIILTVVAKSVSLEVVTVEAYCYCSSASWQV